MGLRGRFITFEGTEGAGKSTLIQSLSQRLNALGVKTHLTREPGGTELGEKIRSVILENPMSSWTELFLYEAARAEHVRSIILPLVGAGKWVLCDRFTDSSLAYQSAGRGLNWKAVQQLNQHAIQELKIDASVFLDLPPEIGLARATERNRFEAEALKFHHKVRKGYLRSIRENPKRWIKIPCKDLSPQQVLDKTWDAFKKRRWIKN